jgi:Spy/CpxP family protein refolding chaperone
MGPGACGPKAMCGDKGECGGIAEKLGACLGLTEEQTAQIEKICPAEQPKLVALRKEMKRVRHDLRGEMMKDEPDLSKAKKYAERIGEIRASIQIAHLECQIAIRKILTPEQRDRLLLMGPRCFGDREDCGPRGHGMAGCASGPRCGSEPGGMQRHECRGGAHGGQKAEM